MIILFFLAALLSTPTPDMAQPVIPPDPEPGWVYSKTYTLEEPVAGPWRRCVGVWYPVAGTTQAPVVGPWRPVR